MRQNLITLGFFFGILSLPIVVTICGESVAQAYRPDHTHDAPAVVMLGSALGEASAK